MHDGWLLDGGGHRWTSETRMGSSPGNLGDDGGVTEDDGDKRSTPIRDALDALSSSQVSDADGETWRDGTACRDSMKATSIASPWT
jgi:hypothetical protein